MPFKNRIRLPFYITRPQFPRESNVFRRADGSTKVQSVIIRKVFEGETDNLPKDIHERLIIALSHDDVTIEGRYLTTGTSLDGDYDIDWNKFLDHPLAKASFKVQVTPFNYSNDNCQTCDEASQLSLEDDTITGPYETHEEGQEYSYNVFANDSICCSPVTAEIVTYDSLYVASASISAASGIVTIVMQATMPSATLANLLTYRVTCPNGSYDDADVFANINGSEPPPSCETPSNLQVTGIAETGATITWDFIAGPVLYVWQLYLASDLITPINSGVSLTNSVIFSGTLMPGTDYVFYVQTNCTDSSSGFANVPFSTLGESTGGCGQYEICNVSEGIGTISVTYMNCAGSYTNTFIPHSSCSTVCALEDSLGSPVDIFSGGGDITIEYIGPC
jgi:hypothetical protein